MRYLFLTLFAFITGALFADSEQHQVQYPFIYDHHFSPYAGAADILSTQRSLMAIEDLLIGRVSHGSSDSMGAGMGRILDLALIWGPINSLGYLTQRTYFGTDYRRRDLGDVEKTHINFRSKIPPYYDHADVKVIYDPQTPLTQVVDTTIAGFEASSILAGQMRLTWLSSGQIDARQSSLYMMSSLDLMGAALKSHEDNISHPTSELEWYFNYMDQLYPESLIDYDGLLFKSATALADPFLWYAAYSELYYIIKGEPVDMPMIPFFGGSGYLPGLSMGLAPYGPEIYFHNFFRTGHGSAVQAYVKWGSLGGEKHFGAGIEAPHLFRFKSSTLGVKVDYFDQFTPLNDFAISTQDEPQIFEGIRRVKGWAASIIASQSPKPSSPASLYFQLGYKTRGYLPGESLQAGVIARGGISIKFSP